MSENRDQPAAAGTQGTAPVPAFDPDATLSGPIVPDDPDATVSGPLAEILKKDDADPEITIKPLPKADDPDATYSGPLFDPDATVSSPGPRRRKNPFQPKALPEALQANLAALGGLNPLVAFANPILSAVPQLRAAESHPDPARLKETLQDLVEAFEAGAGNAGTSDEVLEASVYALCCLADDAAASTAWGSDWEKSGLLKVMRDETGGGAEFFELLKAMQEKPAADADLLELLYICLALGFEGRYRGTEGGIEELGRIRAALHAMVTRHRPRPDALSTRWQGVPADFVPKAKAPKALVAPAAKPGWGRAGAAVAAMLVVLVGYFSLRQPAPGPVETKPVEVAASAPASATTSSTPAAAPVAVPASSLREALATQAKDGRVTLGESKGDGVIALRDDRQFPSGQVEPSPAARAVLESVGAALDPVPGNIVVRGYADGVPVRVDGAFASNQELSAARAAAAAKVLASKLARPQRVTSEGAAEADPIAPNDTEENRAKNRRVVILVGPKP